MKQKQATFHMKLTRTTIIEIIKKTTNAYLELWYHELEKIEEFKQKGIPTDIPEYQKNKYWNKIQELDIIILAIEKGEHGTIEDTNGNSIIIKN